MKGRLFIVMMLLAGFTSSAAAEEKIEPADKQIDWLFDWQQALAEAKRTERPIMLAYGVPGCGGVPGLW